MARFLALLEDPSTSEEGEFDVDVVVTRLGAQLSDDPRRAGIGLLPIALLDTEDVLCLDYRRSPASPTVVVWDIERSREWSPVVEEVAQSFGEFATRTRLLPVQGV